MSETTNGAFVAAISALISGDGAALASELARLDAAAEAVLQAQLPAQEVAVEALPVGTAPEEASVAASAEVTPEQVALGEQVAPNEAGGEAASEGLEPPVTTPDAEGSELTTTADPAVEDVIENAAADLEPARLDPARLGGAAANTPLNLDAYALPEAATLELIDAYRGRGFGSVDEVVTHLFALGAQALVAAERGDGAAAQTFISELRADYAGLLAPLVASVDAERSRRTLELASALAASPALRLQDTAVLLEQLQASAELLEGGTPGLSGEVEAAATVFWGGFVRLALLILLGALAFLPLYLLNLAFGGGNRNWQWVGVSLFLLLLPIIFEGLISLGGLLAYLTGIEVLNALAPFSPFQNVVSQIVWVALTGTAIAFAVTGLYGICVQFGLLGKRNEGSAEDPSQTVVEMGSPETAIDWDEEF